MDADEARHSPNLTTTCWVGSQCWQRYITPWADSWGSSEGNPITSDSRMSRETWSVFDEHRRLERWPHSSWP